MESKTNGVAKTLVFLGYLEIAAGIILGFVLGIQEVDYGFSTREEMNWVVFAIWSGAGFISGMMFIALAEIIELLHRLNKKSEVNSEDEDLIRIK